MVIVRMGVEDAFDLVDVAQRVEAVRNVGPSVNQVDVPKCDDSHAGAVGIPSIALARVWMEK